MQAQSYCGKHGCPTSGNLLDGLSPIVKELQIISWDPFSYSICVKYNCAIAITALLNLQGGVLNA